MGGERGEKTIYDRNAKREQQFVRICYFTKILHPTLIHVRD